jgi:predicted MFS family arabinose efflux permease
VAGLVAFLLVERHSRHPMMPLDIFSTRSFAAANLVTFLVYAASSGVFFLVVLNLQVVSGYSPLGAGITLLPVTALMLLLSARVGALAQRIGPRIPLTAGPLLCAVSSVLLSMIGENASYVPDVLPAVLFLGLGLSLVVAPLTATALGALDDAQAGIASGVNNAVARVAGLLAVATLPLAAGLGDGNLTDAQTLSPVYRNSMLICAGLMVAGGVVAWLLVPSRGPVPSAPEDGAPLPVLGEPYRSFCDPAAPPIHACPRPEDVASAADG